MELRCQGNLLFGIVQGSASGELEVKCRGKRCGHGKGTVVLHIFDLSSGKVLETKKYNDPREIFNSYKQEA